MSWLSSFFSSGGTQQTSESKTAKQRKSIDKMLEEYMPELGQGTDIFPGRRVTPLTDLQQKSLTGAGRFVDYFSQPQAAGTPLFEETGAAAKKLLAGDIGATGFKGASGIDLTGATDFRGATAADIIGARDITGAKSMGRQDIEDYFGGAIYDPTMKTLRKDVIPGISESYAGPGFFGSARSHEESGAYKDTADYLSTQRAGLEWDVLGRNQEIAEALAARRFAKEEALAGRRTGVAESEADRRFTAKEALVGRRFGAAESEADRRFTAGEGLATRSLAALPSAMAYGQVPAQEIRNNLEIAASKIGNLGALFGFGQAEQTQAQAELQDEIMRFAEENQITDPENLEILLTLLGMNFARSQGTREGPGLGYGMLTGASEGFGQAGGMAAAAALGF